MAAQLSEILAAPDCVSVNAAAAQIGLNPRTLHSTFGLQAKAISKRYLEQEEARNSYIFKKRCVAIEKAFLKVVEEGHTPSRNRVAAYLKDHGELLNKKDKAYYETLRTQLFAKLSS